MIARSGVEHSYALSLHKGIDKSAQKQRIWQLDEHVQQAAKSILAPHLRALPCHVPHTVDLLLHVLQRDARGTLAGAGKLPDLGPYDRATVVVLCAAGHKAAPWCIENENIGLQEDCAARGNKLRRVSRTYYT